MSERNLELIEKYLDGELTGDELLSFENELKINKELSDTLSLHRIIREEMQQSVQGRTQENALVETLQGLRKDYFKTKEAKVVGINRRWWYVVAAVAASVVLFFIIQPFSASRFDNEKLYASYIGDEEPLPEAQRGNDRDPVLAEATRLYNKKAYDSALPLLKDIVTRKTGETQLLFATGRAYMQTGQLDSADKIFDSIAAGATIFKSEAIWTRALLLLKQNKLQECYEMLARLPADADKFDAAQKLMKKIDREIKKRVKASASISNKRAPRFPGRP